VGRAGETGDEVVAMAPVGPRPISPSDLVRLRRGELDPNAVADLAARAAGLSAPAAPPEGDLVPNGSGWLIGTGERRRQLYPELNRRADPWERFLPLFTGPGMSLSFAVHSRLLGALAVGIPILVLLASAIVPRRKVRRQLQRAERADRLASVPEGTLVRVTGTIGSQAAVPTLFRGIPAVLFRNRIATAHETRGLDFFLDLDEGGQARVAVRRAFLLDAPTRTREPPACGPVSAHSVGRYQELRSDLFAGVWASDLEALSSLRPLVGRYESSVGPGDRVEVCGVVRHVPAPDVEARFLRVPPMRSVIEAGEDLPLLVRRA
jgi:hypothetical protein